MSMISVKRICLLGALLVLACSLPVQGKGKVGVGIIGGLTSTRTDFGTAWQDMGAMNLYHAGVAVRLPLVENFITLQPALLYNVKGSKVADIGKPDAEAFEFKTGYLELPVQLQIGFAIGKPIRFFGLAEPFAGFALNSVISDGQIQKDNLKNMKTRWSWGVGLGGGIELFRLLQLSVKYVWNFGNPYSEDIQFDGKDIFSNFTISKCGGITASVALLF